MEGGYSSSFIPIIVQRAPYSLQGLIGRLFKKTFCHNQLGGERSRKSPSWCLATQNPLSQDLDVGRKRGTFAKILTSRVDSFSLKKSIAEPWRMVRVKCLLDYVLIIIVKIRYVSNRTGEITLKTLNAVRKEWNRKDVSVLLSGHDYKYKSRGLKWWQRLVRRKQAQIS